MTGARARRGGAIALAALIAGCASGPALRGGVWRDRAQGWSIAAPPAEWQRIRAEGSDLAFRGPRDATFALTSRCEGFTGSPAALARQLRAGLDAHALVEKRDLELAGKPARLQVLDLATRRVRTLTRVAPPCVQDFVLVAPRDFTEVERPFDAWWGSFAPAPERAP